MSKLLSRIAAYFSNRSMVGVDRAGNRYFTRTEQIDGALKEKRWVIFKGEQNPNSIPVEWICWLNGQRKRAPTPEEMAKLEEMRERVKQNVALIKKEEEERKAKDKGIPKATSAGKVAGPDLRSFINQFPNDSKSGKQEGTSNIEDSSIAEEIEQDITPEPQSSEPLGSGASFRPGAWQPPT